MMRFRLLLAVLATASMAAFIPVSQASAGTVTASPRWLIEHSAIQYIYPYRQQVSQDAWVMSEGKPVTNAEHYSSIAPCTSRGSYQMPCNSLAESNGHAPGQPSPAGEAAP